jgi:hypothetical protein
MTDPLTIWLEKGAKLKTVTLVVVVVVLAVLIVVAAEPRLIAITLAFLALAGLMTLPRNTGVGAMGEAYATAESDGCWLLSMLVALLVTVVVFVMVVVVVVFTLLAFELSAPFALDIVALESLYMPVELLTEGITTPLSLRALLVDVPFVIEVKVVFVVAVVLLTRVLFAPWAALVMAVAVVVFVIVFVLFARVLFAL